MPGPAATIRCEPFSGLSHRVLLRFGFEMSWREQGHGRPFDGPRLVHRGVGWFQKAKTSVAGGLFRTSPSGVEVFPAAYPGAGAIYHPSVPAPPLKGPSRSEVTHPP